MLEEGSIYELRHECPLVKTIPLHSCSQEIELARRSEREELIKKIDDLKHEVTKDGWMIGSHMLRRIEKLKSELTK